MSRNKILSFISTFIFCFIVWSAFVLKFNTGEIVGGLLVSCTAALAASRFFIHEKPMYFFNLLKVFWLIIYVPVFIKELIRGNIDMARRALNTSLPVNPGIVKVSTELKSEYGLAMLCNSITLIPGTISMDVIEEEDGRNYIYVHWIDVKSTNPEEAGKIIKGSLESSIRRIWG